MTAQALATQLEVTPRTIYRDLDALSGAGVPVYTERGPQGGCMLLEQYRTNLTGLKDSEVRALFMLTVPGLLADLGVEREADSALLKLSASLPTPFQASADKVRERFYLDPAGWFQPPEPTPYLSILQKAIWEQQRVKLLYRTGGGTWINRVMEPFGLVAKSSIWYVVGRIAKSIQVYRVSRVQEATLLEGTFTRPETFNLADYWTTWRDRFENSKATYKVKLSVAPAGLAQLVQLFGDGMYSVLEEAEQDGVSGREIIELPFSSLESASQQLMGLGEPIEIIEPLELRQKIKEDALALWQRYA